jgi:hypothetical protein
VNSRIRRLAVAAHTRIRPPSRPAPTWTPLLAELVSPAEEALHVEPGDPSRPSSAAVAARPERNRRHGWRERPITGRIEAMAIVTDYRFGHVVVDGEEHTRDLIVLPTRVVGNWWRREGHSLFLEDLEDVADELPAHLLVGCGASSQMRPDPETVEALRGRGIEVEVLPTAEAVRRYGELDPMRAAAALHLTC